MSSLFRVNSGVNQSRIQPTNAYPGLGQIDAGTITVVAGANLTTDDSDTFTINDGVHTPITFAFDHDSSLPYNTSYTVVEFIGTETATEVRDLVIDAINDCALQVFAESNGSDSLYVWPTGPSGPLELRECD
jgi:hypothetical protein